METSQKCINEYTNGNVSVRIFEDGTKIREYEGTPNPVHPETIDVKVTNKCDLSHICTYCHEQSNNEGQHADLTVLSNFFKKNAFPGLELAIGGGDPLSHPKLILFLYDMKRLGVICNITINQLHLKKHYSKLVTLVDYELVKGIGISYRDKIVQSHVLTYLSKYQHVVWHVIAGINEIDCLEDIRNSGFDSALVLGYKKFGNGKTFYNSEVDANLKRWYQRLPRHMSDDFYLSFDNLGLEQLNVKRFIKSEIWDNIYMGDDGMFSMYIDAVEQTAHTSSTQRLVKNNKITNSSLQELFERI